MRVGIPIWNDRVSPVLDTAERLLVVDTGAAAGRAREEVALDSARLPLRATRISELGLDILVCGAVSTQLIELLEIAGVQVRPWIAGDVNEVLGAVATGLLDRPRYRMPGCGRGVGGQGQGRNCRRRSGGQGRNR